MKKKLCIMLSLSMLCLTGCSSAENLTFEETDGRGECQTSGCGTGDFG